MGVLRWPRARQRVDHVDVLVVCLANYTRSPYIAAELSHRAAGRLTVGSAGVNALKPSRGVDRRVLPHVPSPGPDVQALEAHRPRQLTAGMISSATLVIAASREIRGVIDSIAPGTTDRVFTLLELATLLHGVDPFPADGLTGLVRLAASRRSHELLADPGTDLADPRGKAPEAYRAMVQTVAAALDVAFDPILAAIDGPGEREQA